MSVTQQKNIKVNNTLKLWGAMCLGGSDIPSHSEFIS